MVEIGYSPLVPTVFDGNMLQIHSKYWWLRSPITNWNGIAFCVIPSGGFDDNIVDYVDSRSYGRSHF